MEGKIVTGNRIGTSQFDFQTVWNHCFDLDVFQKSPVADKQLRANISGQPMTLRPIGQNSFEANGRFIFRGKFEFKRHEDGRVVGFRGLGQDFSSVEVNKEANPDQWQRFLGSYGPEFIPLVISNRHGHLYAMTENMVDYRLTPVTATLFAMPEGLYADEYLVFELDATGNVHAATLANMTLRRHP